MKPPAKRTVREWVVGGLRIYARGNTFHIGGTLRVGTRSREVRKSLGVAATKANRDEAEREAQKLIAKVRAELGGGVMHKSVSTLVDERLVENTGNYNRATLKEFVARFTTRILFDIPPEEIIAYVDERQRNNKAETRERHISIVCAFLNRQVKAGQYPKLPAFRRDSKARNATTRAHRNVQQFRPALVNDLIAAADIAIQIQLRVEFVCGARLSSILKGATLESLDMQRMEITFWKTKNGANVTSALPETIRPAMERYLAWRQEHVRAGRIGPGSDQALFLTPRGLPYSKEWGSNKTGFNAAKRRALVAVAARYDRAIEAMTEAGDHGGVDRLLRAKADDLQLLAKITQHWFRHKLATDLSKSRSGFKGAKNQGGWRDTRSVIGYLIEDTELQRQSVEERGSPQESPTPSGDGPDSPRQPSEQRDDAAIDGPGGGLAQNPHKNPAGES